MDISHAEFEKASLESQLSADFGRPITGLQRAEGGIISETYSAEFEGEKVFIKLNDNDEVFPKEAAVLRLLKERGIPVPSVLDFKKVSNGKSAIVETAVRGISADKIDFPERAEIFKKAGNVVKAMHAVRLEGFGPLELKDGALHGKYQTWKEYLQEYNGSTLEYLTEHDLIGKEELSKLKDVGLELLQVELARGSFLHRDLQGGHFFSDGGEITGIIDFGGAASGDPRFDLALARFFMSDDEWAALKDGYGPVADDPSIKEYLIAAAARKLMIRHHKQRGEDSSARAKDKFMKALHE